jgi:hypothetical protein
MESIVMRVRLTSGDHTDVTYEDPDAEGEGQAIERAVAILGKESGVLRCSHGRRLIVLFARGVATIEVAPRGAIL